jgi:hypothetical protein
MFGLVNSDNMETPVYEEFDRMERSFSGFLLAEHYEDGSHNMEPAGLGFVPIGFVGVWPLSTAPPGWHVLNGADLNREQYVMLFSVIGIVFGPGDGSTTFTLPTQAGPGTMFYIIFTGLGV